MDKFRPCSRCKQKKLLGNHERGKFNAKDAEGRQVCTDCTVELIYEKFLSKE